MKYSKNCVLLAKNFDVRIFVRLLAKICAHFCAPFSQNMCTFVRFLKIFDVRIFVRLLAKICAHLSLELLDTLPRRYCWDKIDRHRDRRSETARIRNKNYEYQKNEKEFSSL